MKTDKIKVVLILFLFVFGIVLQPFTFIIKVKSDSFASNHTTLVIGRGDVWNKYRNDNGTYTMEIHSKPVNYKDEHGVYYPINTTLVEQQDGSLMVDRAPYRLVVFANKTGYRVYPDRNNHSAWIDFYLPDLKLPLSNKRFYEVITPTIKNNKLCFENQYFDVNISALNTQVRFEWKIKNKQLFQYMSRKFNMAIIPHNTSISDTGRIKGLNAMLVNKIFDSNDTCRSVDGWSIQNKKLSFEVNDTNLSYPIIIDPTLTVYSSSSDGYIYNYGSSYTIWSSSSGTVEDAFSTFVVGQRYDSGNSLYYIYRGFLFFNTSSIPDSAEISSATINLYGAYDYSDTDFYIQVQNGQPTYPHDPLQSGDYNKGYYNGNGGLLSTKEFRTYSYNTLSLNSDGLSWINKTGWTKLCLRSNNDILGTAPTGDEYVQIYAEEGTYDPYLYINYLVQPSYSDPSPNASTNETSPVTLSLNVSTNGGPNVNITWYNAVSGEVIGTNNSVGDGIYRQTWSCGVGTFQWYATIDNGDYNISTETYWFVVGTTWTDDFDNENLIYNKNYMVVDNSYANSTSGGGQYISFAYHMYGAAMGTLSLLAKDDSGVWHTLWSKSGNQGNAWYFANVSLDGYNSANQQIRFKGQIGSSYTSDMAVDTITIGYINGVIQYDDFESGAGNWDLTVTGDDTDWTRDSGGTPSSSTGPSSGANGSTWYVYTEASGHYNEVAYMDTTVDLSVASGTAANITSVAITKPDGATWNMFSFAVNNSNVCNFSILNASNNEVLLSSLGNNSDISSITANSIRLFGQFNGSLSMDWWRVSWTTQVDINSEYPLNNSQDVLTKLSSLSVYITPGISYSIETSPDVGSTSGTSTGTCTCSVNLTKKYSTYVTWYVNTSSVKKTYHFTTCDGSGFYEKDHVYPALDYQKYSIRKGNYIFSAWGDEGLKVFSFNNEKYTLIDTDLYGNTYHDLATDNNFIYVACEESQGLRAYSFDGGNLILENASYVGSRTCTFINTSLDYPYWSQSDPLLFVSEAGDGVSVYTFNENGTKEFWRKANRDDGGIYEGIYVLGKYIFCAIDMGDGLTTKIYAYTFNESGLNSFTLKATYTFESEVYATTDVFAENYTGTTYVYCVGKGLTILSFNGTSFTKLYQQTGNFNTIYADRRYLYCGCGNDGLKLFSRYTSNYNPVFLTSIYTNGTYWGVFKDDNYLHVSCGQAGLKVYGFDYNGAPQIENVFPADGATDIQLQPTCHINVYDYDGDTMNVYWYENTTGQWVLQQTNASIGDGTYYWTYTNASSVGTTYWWKVAVNDSIHNTTAIYHFTTISDVTPPDITVNFAGNLSGDGGPLYIPPSESGTTCHKGYYVNDSRQKEDWIYINCTILDDSGIDKVFLNWLNDTIWTNWTYELTHTSGDYWEFNSSGVISVSQGHNYSFNIVANDTYGNSKTVWWNKTIVNGGYTRRYVQLSCTPNNDLFNYTPFYFYQIYPYNDDSQTADRLHHDQGNDGTYNDTGYMLNVLPSDTMENLHCGTVVGYWLDQSLCINSITVKNMYLHFWWNTSSGMIRSRPPYGSQFGVLINKSRGALSTEYDDRFFTDYKNASSEITYNHNWGSGSWGSHYWLESRLWNISDFTVDDNSLYEICFKIWDTYPSIINNRSIQSFVIFNVPDNNTLNNTYIDSDADGLTDWQELYVTHTNPFTDDTDNDGFLDYAEYQNSTDPNNYTDFPRIPDPPTDFTADTQNITIINLAWTKGAHNVSTTYIERNTASAWERGDGVVVYNDTGTSYSDTGLTPDTTYYYQAWSYNSSSNTFSLTYASASNCTCIELYENIQIEEDTVVCPQVYSLSDSDTNGSVQIHGSNLYLDLNGATLDGSDVSSSKGITLGSYDHVVIKNGVIQDYYYGIYAGYGDTPSNITLINVTIKSCTYGIYISPSSGENIHIYNSNISNNVRRGIYLSDIVGVEVNESKINYNNQYNTWNYPGLYLVGCENGNISNCDFIDNDVGVLIRAGSTNITLFNCNVSETEYEYGIRVEDTASHVYINKCRLYNNYNIGIYLNQVDHVYINNSKLINTTSSPRQRLGVETITCDNIYLFNVTSNGHTYDGNSGFGMEFKDNSTNCTLNHIIVRNNTEGITIYQSQNFTISNVTADNCTSYGIILEGVYSQNNTVKDSYIKNCAYMILFSSAKYNNVDNITIEQFSGTSYGVAITGCNNVVENLTAKESGGSLDAITVSSGDNNTFKNINVSTADIVLEPVIGDLPENNVFQNISTFDVSPVSISLSDNHIYFNYTHVNDIYLKTNVSSSGSFNRNVSEWTQMNVIWKDDVSTQKTFYYTLYGLSPLSGYVVYDNGQQIYNLTTDSNGVLSFNLTFSSGHVIKVSQQSIINIDVEPESYAFGFLDPNEVVSTSNGYFTITNNGNEYIDVTIRGTNATNSTGVKKWSLVEKTSPGFNEFSLQYSLDEGSTWNFFNWSDNPVKVIYTNLAPQSSIYVDLKLVAPSGTDCYEEVNWDVYFGAVQTS